MERILLEACCGGADDVYAAKAAGADRAELNAAMPLGGLTPSIGTMQVATGAGIPVIAMVRPRSGGFCYSEYEFETMCKDAAALLLAGAQGIAFGILTKNGTIDEKRCETLLSIIGNGQKVFHRAFDVTPNWRASLDALCSLGFTRVLSSGQASSALEGAHILAQMAEYARGRIEILPGGGIRPYNAAEIAVRTGCSQMHASLSSQRIDQSASANPVVHFSAPLYPPEHLYTRLDQAGFRDLGDALCREISLCDMQSE
ncbi:MAG: copper homeostasis protein CutC [Candidatus Pelethousia sp.]|nr:copper homeostasis protein CutC [Candidatus Pelethousia sp.]